MSQRRLNDVLNSIKVAPSEFVIDVGGGQRPFWRADLVIEKYPFENGLHRSQPMVFPNVPVVKADAVAIPIPNGGCDLIFASHIIDHLPKPHLFIDEIKRCSRRVYLEFPSRNRELMFAWPFHEWFIEAEGTLLKFYRNDLPQFFRGLFHEEYDAVLGAWSDARHDHLNISIHCDSDELEIEFPEQTATERLLEDAPRGSARMNFAEVINRPQYSLREVVAIAAQSFFPSLHERLSKPARGRATSAALPDSVLARLMCIRCQRTDLRRSGESLTCKCGRSYTQDRGVFDFDTNDDERAL